MPSTVGDVPTGPTDKDDLINNETPLWRYDRKHSDFTIIIQGEESTTKTEYHVHKAILMNTGYGVTSEYFFCQFMNGERFAGNDKTTIPLDEDAAVQFPDLLDYLYTGHIQVSLTLEVAVILLHLADKFVVPTLIEELMEYFNGNFLYSRLQHQCSGVLLIAKYRNDHVFKTRWLVANAQYILADALLTNHKFTHTLLEGIDLDFFIKTVMLCNRIILGANLAGTFPKLFSLNKAIYEYAEMHKADLTRKQYKKLSSEAMLPRIEPEYALKMIEQEARYVNVLTETEATSLQKRCIRSLKEKRQDRLLDVQRVIEMIPQKVWGKLLALSISDGEYQDAELIPSNPDSLRIEAHCCHTRKRCEFQASTVDIDVVDDVGDGGATAWPCYRGVPVKEGGQAGDEEDGSEEDRDDVYVILKFNDCWYFYDCRRDENIQKDAWDLVNKQNTSLPPAWGWQGRGGYVRGDTPLLICYENT